MDSAAKTPLQAKVRVVIDLPMTVDDARNVIWQGKGPREPMGTLLDAKQLSHRDLAWAINGAYRPDVRSAALTLLSAWLGKPETLATTQRYGPKVVDGSHFLEEQWLVSFFRISMLFGVGLTALVVSVLFFVQMFLQNMGWFVIVINLAVVIVGFGAMVYFGKRELERFVSFRRGEAGEEKIVEKIRSALDHEWTIYRNLHLPDRKDDVDIVLVGLGGVWAVEVKAFRPTIRVNGDVWEQQTAMGWKRLPNDPFRQVSKNAIALNDYLQKQGVTRWVERAVAISEPQPISNFDPKEIPVWLLPTIERQVASLMTRIPPTKPELERINMLFKTLADNQLAREEVAPK